MSRLSFISFVAALIVGAALIAGCRIQHLGSDYGKSYYKAVDNQAAGDTSAAPAPMTADDAKRVMRVHRTGEDKGDDRNSGGGATISVPTVSTSSGSLSGPKWQVAGGNIHLEAK